jgi:GT2 family glycosyltransferase
LRSQTSVIVLGYGAEAYLTECLAALDQELDEDDELLLVDNGIVADDANPVTVPPRTVRLGDGANLGFAGGCNHAASRASGDVLVFVNSDAVVRPGGVAALVAAAEEPSIGIASGCLRLADQPDRINSAGNPLQFAGMTWAGACGEPASAHQERGAVAVATGGFFAVRRDVWDALGGFEPAYFAYHEDTDLSLRCWMAGWRVEYIPESVADHHYEFSRNPRKMYLVERNRLMTVFTDYPPAVLRTVLPMVLLLEPAFLMLAVLQGWPVQKLKSWGWIITHAGQLRRRRAHVQQRVTIDDARLIELMCARIEPPMVPAPPGMGLVNAVLAGYWAVARRIITRRGAVRSEHG